MCVHGTVEPWTKDGLVFPPGRGEFAAHVRPRTPRKNDKFSPAVISARVSYRPCDNREEKKISPRRIIARRAPPGARRAVTGRVRSELANTMHKNDPTYLSYADEYSWGACIYKLIFHSTPGAGRGGKSKLRRAIFYYYYYYLYSTLISLRS